MALKNKIIILLMLAASGFFLYQGFSLLFYADKTHKEGALVE
jgi:hypothetical protein